MDVVSQHILLLLSDHFSIEVDKIRIDHAVQRERRSGDLGEELLNPAVLAALVGESLHNVHFNFLASLNKLLLDEDEIRPLLLACDFLGKRIGRIQVGCQDMGAEDPVQGDHAEPGSLNRHFQAIMHGV